MTGGDHGQRPEENRPRAAKAQTGQAQASGRAAFRPWLARPAPLARILAHQGLGPVSLSSWWRGAMPSAAAVRAEIWSLGARHLGWPLEGALDELQATNLTLARGQLLRAC